MEINIVPPQKLIFLKLSLKIIGNYWKICHLIVPPPFSHQGGRLNTVIIYLITYNDIFSLQRKQKILDRNY